METPPIKKLGQVMNPMQLQARLKAQIDNNMDVESTHPGADRLEESLVHTKEIKPLQDDFDDEDLE